MQFHPDAETMDAAQKTEAVLSKYGLSVITENYGTESSLINSLLVDLAKPAVHDAVSKLPGCDQLISALDAAQKNFETAQIAWEEDKARDENQASASELKKEVLKHINHKVLVYLRAMALVEPDSYGDFTGTIGEVISANNESVNRRYA